MSSPTLKEQGVPKCTNHNEKVSLYCPEHDSVFCKHCESAHAKCARKQKIVDLHEKCKEYYVPWSKLKERCTLTKNKLDKLKERIPADELEKFSDRV
jgi:hypothetical protein